MKVLASVAAVVCSLALSCLYGYIVWTDYGLWVIAVCVAMILSLPISSFIHELGHMFFGALCKIKAVPKFSCFGSSFCRLIPKTTRKLKTRVIITSLGGVFFNIAVAAVLHSLVLFAPVPSWLSFIIPSCVYLAVLNIIPAEFYNGKTDGAICVELLNNTDTAKVMLAVMAVQAYVLNGVPIERAGRELLFDLPVIREDDMAFIALCELKSEYFKAAGENDKAEEYRKRFEQLKEEYC